MSLEELKKVEEMAFDLQTVLEEMGLSFLQADAYSIANSLQERIDELVE